MLSEDIVDDQANGRLEQRRKFGPGPAAKRVDVTHFGRQVDASFALAGGIGEAAEEEDFFTTVSGKSS